MPQGRRCVACSSAGTIGGQRRGDGPRGGCRQQWSHAGAAPPLRAMYRLAWGAVQRGLADALLGYAVALWKRSRPRPLPAPPSGPDDDEDAFCGLHHRDCPCRTHPPLRPPPKVTNVPRRPALLLHWFRAVGRRAGRQAGRHSSSFCCPGARQARLPGVRHGATDIEAGAWAPVARPGQGGAGQKRAGGCEGCLPVLVGSHRAARDFSRYSGAGGGVLEHLLFAPLESVYW